MTIVITPKIIHTLTGKFKDEDAGIPIVEFTGLRSKMHSYVKDDGKKKRKDCQRFKKVCDQKKYRQPRLQRYSPKQ